MSSKSTKMSEAMYLAANKTTFDSLKLSAKERKAKYIKYKAKKKNETSNNNQSGSSARITRPALSKTIVEDCTITYAKVLTNPFDTIPEACIPDAICLPSFKYSTVCLGTLKTGEEGAGWIAVNPFLLCASDWGMNGGSVDYPVVTSTENFNTSVFYVDPGVITGGAVKAYNSNSYFTSAKMLEGEMRLVGAGVEIYYVGQMLTQSGVVVTLQNDGLKDFPNGTTIEKLQANPRSSTCPVSSKGSCYLTYTPTDHKVTGYSPVSEYEPFAQGTGKYYPLLIFISGTQPGASFQFRVKAYYEFQLPGMSVTPSHADPQGMAKVLQYKTEQRVTNNPAADSDNFITGMLRGIGKFARNTAPIIGAAVGAAAGDPRLGLAAGSTVKNVMDALLR